MSENKLNASKRMKRKPWPGDCIWPEPLHAGEGMQWEEDLLPESLDERAQELMDIKDYFDSLVESGRLHEDYTLNPDYEEDAVDDETEETEDGWADDEFIPKIGEDYWDEEGQRFVPKILPCLCGIPSAMSSSMKTYYGRLLPDGLLR